MKIFVAFNQLNGPEQILWLLFLAAAIYQISYWIWIYLPLSGESSSKPEAASQPGISIVVAAKDESNNIKRIIPALLNQQYSEFEILWVDDHSSDDSLQQLEKFQSKQLRVVQLPSELKGKKQAVKYGIKQASYENLLFLDADCLPASQQWLMEFNEAFASGANLILGHGRYEKRKGILNALIRYESLWNALQFLSRAQKGKAYSAVGRNLAYTRTLFLNSSQFSQHEHILSGDDDLFVNEIASAARTAICVEKQSHTISLPKESWKAYIRQKRRHLQAGNHYKSSDRLRLGLFILSQQVFSVSFLGLVYIATDLLLIFGIFALKQMIQSFLLFRLSKKFGDADMIWKSWGLESLYIATLTTIGISTWFWKVETWK